MTYSPQTEPQARHLVAINCHPFHNSDRIPVSLESTFKAAQDFHEEVGEEIKVVVFWHNDQPVPEILQHDIDRFGFELQVMHHANNGANLNQQIEYAIAHKFDLFFRVDGDDAVLTTRFSLQHLHMTATGCDICGGALYYQVPDVRPFVVMPPVLPTLRDYVENQYILHPTMTFKVAAFAENDLRYWSKRLEDKALVRQAIRKGLRVENVRDTSGAYVISKNARNTLALKWLGYRLNMACLLDNWAFHLMPYATAVFAAHAVIGAHRMRKIRAILRSDEPAPTPKSILAPLMWWKKEQKQHP